MELSHRRSIIRSKNQNLVMEPTHNQQVQSSDTHRSQSILFLDIIYFIFIF